jgi:hypothetical protein
MAAGALQEIAGAVVSTTLTETESAVAENSPSTTSR